MGAYECACLVETRASLSTYVWLRKSVIITEPRSWVIPSGDASHALTSLELPSSQITSFSLIKELSNFLPLFRVF